MPPFHPLLVHFPIALIWLTLLLQFIRLIKNKLFSPTIPILVLGLSSLGSIASSISGEKSFSILQDQLSPELLTLIERHELFANLTLWLSLVTVITWLYLLMKHWNPLWLDRLIFLVLILLFLFVSMTGYLGGELVYSHHIGIL